MLHHAAVSRKSHCGQARDSQPLSFVHLAIAARVGYGMRSQPDAQSLLRQAEERLRPPLSNPNWLVLRTRRKIFEKWIALIPGTALRILDVGGRLQPYRPLFAERADQYYAADLRPGPLVNVVASAGQLPFASDSFDVVVCTQVLEYVARPQEAVDEIRRVLKAGGSLLLSVPSIFPRDSDPEYWRFLPSAVRMMLSGFAEVEVEAEGSSVAGLFRTLNVWGFVFSPAWLRFLLRYSSIPVVNALGYFAEAVIGSKNDQFSANFSAWARK
jgi:SAM-dependent methyltransferase